MKAGQLGGSCVGLNARRKTVCSRNLWKMARWEIQSVTEANDSGRHGGRAGGDELAGRWTLLSTILTRSGMSVEKFSVGIRYRATHSSRSPLELKSIWAMRCARRDDAQS